MLVMFAAGFASVWSMAALTVLMAGIVLLLAVLTTVSGPLPGGL